MLKLERSPSPQCLAENWEAWTTAFVERRAADNKARFRWPQPACYDQVRSRLRDMTGRRCSFCDGPLATVSRETVEHFRPKLTFPSLAYKWENLFACCDLCQSNKLERFHESLLKPDDPEYSFEKYFVVNFRDGGLQPLPSASAADQERARLTIEYYGLDSGPRKEARRKERLNNERAGCTGLDEFDYRFYCSA